MPGADGPVHLVVGDITARDLQKKDGQWTRAKGHDTFCPLGPWIETTMKPDDLALRTELLDQCGEIEAAEPPSTTAMRIAPSTYSSVLGGLGTATGGSAGTSPRGAKLVGW